MRWFICVGIMLVSAAPGCAVVKPTRSGYLSDYSHVRTASDRVMSTTEANAAGAGALAGVDSFYVEDVRWLSARPAKVAKRPDLQEQVLSVLRESLREELGKVRPVVDAPGPRTARVRAAVTDARNADLLFNLLMTAIAIPLANGGATVEAEVIGPDGRQVAAVDYARAGGLFDVVGYYWPNDHAKIACRRAAAALREAVEAKAGKAARRT